MPSDPYARLLNGMLPFHNNFRFEHAQIVRGIPQSQSTPRFGVQKLMQQALQLCHHLEMHHTIEEAHIFPLLAVKLPSFAHDAAHISEHKAMHDRLEELEAYSSKVLQDMRSSIGKKAEAEGCGQPLRTEEQDSDDDAGVKRKAWPSSLYDEEKFNNLINGLAQALFPHLEAEEASLKAENLKKHGLTLHDLARIPM
jgi:hypothetical protein